MAAILSNPASRWPPLGSGVAHVRLEDLLALEAQGVRLARHREGTRDSGERHSARLRARGLAYAESRPYQTGDDARSIDWRVTARTTRTHTKLFEEEREQPVWLCVDLRESMHFGTRAAFKSVQAAHVAALLGWSALAGGDRVGCLALTSDGPKIRPPRRGRPALLAVLGLLVRAAGLVARADTRAGTAAVRVAAGPLIDAAGSRARVYVLSDFIAFDAAAFTELRALAHRHLLTLLQVVDPFEQSPPPLPGAWMSDAHGRPTRFDPQAMSERPDTPQRLGERLEQIATLTGAGFFTTLTTEAPRSVAKRLLAGARPRTGAR